MKRSFWYIIVNSIFAISIYYGLFMGHEGATNIVYFIAWVEIISSFCAINDNVYERMKKEGRSAPHWISLPLNFIVVICFVYKGMFFTAFFYGLGAVLIESAWNKIEEEKQ